MNVLKFGGTSVGSAQRIQEVAKLISDNQPKIVVLSAMSGTTNTLVDITNYLYHNDRQEALTTIQNLELDYLMTISDLYSTGDKNLYKPSSPISAHSSTRTSTRYKKKRWSPKERSSPPR